MDEVIVNRDGPVLRIRLNRPESRNALNFDVIDQILDALEALVGDANVNFGLPLSAREFCRRLGCWFPGSMAAEEQTQLTRQQYDQLRA